MSLCFREETHIEVWEVEAYIGDVILGGLYTGVVLTEFSGIDINERWLLQNIDKSIFQLKISGSLFSDKSFTNKVV